MYVHSVSNPVAKHLKHHRPQKSMNPSPLEVYLAGFYLCHRKREATSITRQHVISIFQQNVNVGALPMIYLYLLLHELSFIETIIHQVFDSDKFFYDYMTIKITSAQQNRCALARIQETPQKSMIFFNCKTQKLKLLSEGQRQAFIVLTCSFLNKLCCA